ncbi:S8/S53 family peptidase [Schaalia odontolytica]|nr:S8 family serine peptidase [Schaalia odontolytica]MCQ5273169.1 S8/S53 family peptidase [Schaalia odontolytica]MCQ5282079.1 S8/S53 family peptidase [Schaalia odontolytica]
MTLALAAGAIALPAAPAHAADPITAADQSYFAYYHLDQARTKGYTGKGVTIALIDGEVDTTAPELAGATIIDKSPCTVHSSTQSKSHATAVASLLVSKAYGVAPDATLLTYRTSFEDEGEDTAAGCAVHNGNGIEENNSLINRAISDGAQIISISSSDEDFDEATKWTIARANARGVIVVTAMGNTAKDETDTGLAKWSGVVGVGAIDTAGKVASYSSWGQGTTTAAVGGPIIVRNYQTGNKATTDGTSYSTPLIAGFLALAKQKWPNATSNQLLQLLTKTALNNEGRWNKYTGYGVADLGAMMNTDPSQYPDENPLMDPTMHKGPSTDEIQQYMDGLVNPRDIAFDDSYTYRGADESVISNTDAGVPIHLGTSPRYHAK